MGAPPHRSPASPAVDGHADTESRSPSARLEQRRYFAAALVFGKEGTDVLRIAIDGGDVVRERATGRASFPAFRPSVRSPASSTRASRSRVTVPRRRSIPTSTSTGRSRSATTARISPRPMPAAWWNCGRPISERPRHRVSSFSRDAYAPSIAAMALWSSRCSRIARTLAESPSTGGATRQLTTFQSETPSYHPTQPADRIHVRHVAARRGRCEVSGHRAGDRRHRRRREHVPAAKPLEVIAQSDSEDQAMAWSPNGKWIAFHTHREMSDDVWLRPADGKQPDKRITFLGRGAEVGWPRWSPDGKTVLLEGARKSDGRSVIYAIGVDQETGATTSELREIRADGFRWRDEATPNGSATTAVIAVAKEGPGRHAILTLPIAGGAPSDRASLRDRTRFSGTGRVARRAVRSRLPRPRPTATTRSSERRSPVTRRRCR